VLNQRELAGGRQIESELPAAVLRGASIGRAVEASGLDSRVNRARKGIELDLPNPLAREVWESFAAASLLHSANIHNQS